MDPFCDGTKSSITGVYPVIELANVGHARTTSMLRTMNTIATLDFKRLRDEKSRNSFQVERNDTSCCKYVAKKVEYVIG